MRVRRVWIVLGTVTASLSVLGAIGAATQRGLTISGAFHTSSARAVPGRYAGCGQIKNHRLVYESKALRIGRGRAVAQVSFVISHYRGPGRYAAAAPLPDGRTALQVGTAPNAATGVTTRFYVASSGTITILRSRKVAGNGPARTLSGTLHARLHRQHGTGRIRVDGAWRCNTGSKPG